MDDDVQWANTSARPAFKLGGLRMWSPTLTKGISGKQPEKTYRTFLSLGWLGECVFMEVVRLSVRTWECCICIFLVQCEASIGGVGWFGRVSFSLFFCDMHAQVRERGHHVPSICQALSLASYACLESEV